MSGGNWPVEDDPEILDLDELAGLDSAGEADSEAGVIDDALARVGEVPLDPETFSGIGGLAVESEAKRLVAAEQAAAHLALSGSGDRTPVVAEALSKSQLSRIRHSYGVACLLKMAGGELSYEDPESQFTPKFLEFSGLPARAWNITRNSLVKDRNVVSFRNGPSHRTVGFEIKRTELLNAITTKDMLLPAETLGDPLALDQAVEQTGAILVKYGVIERSAAGLGSAAGLNESSPYAGYLENMITTMLPSGKKPAREYTSFTNRGTSLSLPDFTLGDPPVGKVPTPDDAIKYKLPNTIGAFVVLGFSSKFLLATQVYLFTGAQADPQLQENFIKRMMLKHSDSRRQLTDKERAALNREYRRTRARLIEAGKLVINEAGMMQVDPLASDDLEAFKTFTVQPSQRKRSLPQSSIGRDPYTGRSRQTAVSLAFRRTWS